MLPAVLSGMPASVIPVCALCVLRWLIRSLCVLVLCSVLQLKSCQGMIPHFKKHRMDMLQKFPAFSMGEEEASQKAHAICEKLKCC